MRLPSRDRDDGRSDDRRRASTAPTQFYPDQILRGEGVYSETSYVPWVDNSGEWDPVTPYVAPYVDNYVEDEAMNAMYAGACPTCYAIGTTLPNGHTVTASDLKSHFYSQPDPFGRNTDSVDAIQSTSCRRRSKARRSSTRRNLSQKVKACVQANAETLLKAIERVRRSAPARRSTTHATDLAEASARGNRGGSRTSRD